MRIHAPDITSASGSITLSARVSVETAATRLPDTLWFSLPERYEPMIARGTEPFVVALRPSASILNEDITIEGRFSERLSHGLNEYTRVFNAWAPQKFNPIRLVGAELVPDEPTSGHTAAAFSGGVDSFFTQFMARSQPPSFRSKYAVFVHGLDIPLHRRDVFDSAAARYGETFAELGIECVPVRSNVRAFVPDWELGHGASLGAVALLLARGLNRFLVPSSMSYTTLRAWGSHPMVDALLSTDQLQIIHDGAYYSRFDKLRLIKDWAVLHDLLRVCYEKPDAVRNCGQCAKCRRTMMMLESLGVLKEFKTFPSVRAPFHYLSCHFNSPHERFNARQIIATAESSGRSDLAWVGRFAMQRSVVDATLKRVRKFWRPVRRGMRMRLARRVSFVRASSTS